MYVTYTSSSNLHTFNGGCLKDVGKCNSKFHLFAGPVLLDEFVEWQKVHQAS